MNAAPSAWDEYEMARQRPDLFPAPPDPPTLGRDALQALRPERLATVCEHEAAWQRRNRVDAPRCAVRPGGAPGTREV